MKDAIIVLLVILAVLLLYLNITGSTVFHDMFSNSNPDQAGQIHISANTQIGRTTSIQQVTENPTAYIGKSLTIRGTAQGAIDYCGFDDPFAVATLLVVDSDGYYLHAKMPEGRLLTGGKMYTLTGTLKEGAKGNCLVLDTR